MAKIVFEVKDPEGNLVEIETSEMEFDNALSGYPNFLKLITARGFTPVKAKGNGAKQEKVKIDGKTCPVCKSPVYDNRAKKASGEFKPNAPDFSCSNKACTGGSNGQKWVAWQGSYEIV